MKYNDIREAQRALADVEAARDLFSQSDYPWSNKWHGRDLHDRGRDKLNAATRRLDAMAARGDLPADLDCRRTLEAANAEVLDVSAARRHIGPGR